MVHDIRQNLPRLPQNDPNRYPPYQYKPYPRMMTREVDGKKIPYRDVAGRPVVVKDATEEAHFLSKHDDRPAKSEAAPSADAPKMTAPEEAPVDTAFQEAKRGPGRPRMKLPENLD